MRSSSSTPGIGSPLATVIQDASAGSGVGTGALAWAPAGTRRLSVANWHSMSGCGVAVGKGDLAAAAVGAGAEGGPLRAGVAVVAAKGGGATVGAAAAPAGVGLPAGAANAAAVGLRVEVSGVGVCHAAGVAVAPLATPGDAGRASGAACSPQPGTRPRTARCIPKGRQRMQSAPPPAIQTCAPCQWFQPPKQRSKCLGTAFAVELIPLPRRGPDGSIQLFWRHDPSTGLAIAAGRSLSASGPGGRTFEASRRLPGETVAEHAFESVRWTGREPGRVD